MKMNIFVYGMILNEEAIRLVKCMSGKWIPAKSHGKAIDSWFYIPVVFKLEEKL